MAVTSASEAELGVLFMNLKERTVCWLALMELGYTHSRPRQSTVTTSQQQELQMTV